MNMFTAFFFKTTHYIQQAATVVSMGCMEYLRRFALLTEIPGMQIYVPRLRKQLRIDVVLKFR